MKIKEKGFTLIEFLVYIAIASIVLGALSDLYFTIYNLRAKNQAVSEGEQQGVQIIQLITQTIRNSASITSPVTAASSTTLTLQTYSSSTSPTVLSIRGGIVSIQEGTSTAVVLNSPRTSVGNLTFQNLTRSGTHGIIRVSFTISYVNPTSRTQNNFTRNFYDSAAVRGVYP
jgi:prepilin-type N-terminal cleavage/methylation domain-containing protein